MTSQTLLEVRPSSRQDNMDISATLILDKPKSEPIKEQPSRLRGFLAGVASGVTKLCVGHPFDTIKVRLQTSGLNSRFNGPLHCLKQTIRKEGFRALYKGATPPLIGWGIMDSVMLGSLHNYRLLLQGNDPTVKLNVFQHTLAGAGAGITVSFVATPIEQIKARLQVQYDSTTKLYNGPIDCARKLVRNNGIRGLWFGLAGTMAFRSFFSVFWGSYELYSRALRKTNLNEPTINFLAGGLSANNFWICAMPFDTIKNRFMTQPDVKPLRFPNIWSCATFIYQTEGIRGFYKGFIPCILRSFPTNASAILAFETTMRLLKNSGI
ncbi:mitochondrial carrier [Gigaspora margarita]|uniref:Mitochondrial carrier n=1 Tax=Gigaspora margarita TaxID=4874 RepID=A0A8H4A6J2_GIGMA|nr:mitochondrial carrier [Gigaspora margarita]